MKLKELIICILIPIFIGIIGSIIGNPNNFDNIIQPSFTPPKILFPIVWTILYILMGISSYIIYKSNNKEKNIALIIYGISLFINLLWPFFFFTLNWFGFSIFWIILLIIFVILTISKYLEINKISAYLQIPYLIWLAFATVLNISIAFLN